MVTTGNSSPDIMFTLHQLLSLIRMKGFGLVGRNVEEIIAGETTF